MTVNLTLTCMQLRQSLRAVRNLVNMSAPADLAEADGRLGLIAAIALDMLELVDAIDPQPQAQNQAVKAGAVTIRD